MSGAFKHLLSTESFFFLIILVTTACIAWYPTVPGDFLEFSTYTASKWCALGIVICSLLELTFLFRNGSALKKQPDTSARRVSIFIVGVILYVTGLFYFSYYLTTAVAMMAGFLFLGGRTLWLRGLCLTCLWLAVVYLVFEKLLTIILPTGS